MAWCFGLYWCIYGQVSCFHRVRILHWLLIFAKIQWLANLQTAIATRSPLTDGGRWCCFLHGDGHKCGTEPKKHHGSVFQVLRSWWTSSKYSHKAWHVPLKYIKILQNTGIFETLPVPMWENICLILPASFWKGSLYQGRWVSTHRSWNQTLLKLEPEARRTVRAACVSVGTGLWIYIYIYRSRS